ncbi:unnamed protein product, partial [Ectocarpus sp. 12 AP-2014]
MIYKTEHLCLSALLISFVVIGFTSCSNTTDDTDISENGIATDTTG